MYLLLAVHAFLLLLASTEFTIFTAIFGDDSFRWCYFRYFSQNGFGYEYVSDYTLPIVVIYLSAFAVGIVGFSLASWQGRQIAGLLGVILSTIGVISFGIEGSHWLVDHNRSWLAFSPFIMFVLVLLACLPRGSAFAQEAKPSTT